MKSTSFELCKDFVADNLHHADEDNKPQIERLKRIIKQIICNDLTKRQKEVCFLYYYEKRNMPQIAKLLNIDKSTVSRIHAGALKKIKELIKYYQIR